MYRPCIFMFDFLHLFKLNGKILCDNLPTLYSFWSRDILGRGVGFKFSGRQLAKIISTHFFTNPPIYPKVHLWYKLSVFVVVVFILFWQKVTQMRFVHLHTFTIVLPSNCVIQMKLSIHTELWVYTKLWLIFAVQCHFHPCLLLVCKENFICNLHMHKIHKRTDG